MHQLLTIVVLTAAAVAAVNGQTDGCDYYQMIQPDAAYEISSSGYRRGMSAGRNVNCRFAAETPPGYKITIFCQFAFLFPLPRCQNTLRISRRGRVDLKDATTYCGWLGRVSTTSLSNRMTVEFKTGSLPLASKFLCTLKALPDACECGKRNAAGKIVGGAETLVNEFPLMAAIVVGNTGVQCGSTIISTRAVLSAAHCFSGFSGDWSSLRVVVGEHNIAESAESPFTKSYNISSVITPAEYPLESDFDIALVLTREAIVFDFGVSASCLPFKFLTETFADKKVYGLGWGTTEFAGPKSDALRKVELLILDEFICSGYQICATAKDRDTCQFDSGGPMLYQDPDNNLLYNVGIISSGGDCGVGATSDNIRVTAHLNWILRQTMSTVYCVK